jgi:hypothetical protein
MLRALSALLRARSLAAASELSIIFKMRSRGFVPGSRVIAEGDGFFKRQRHLGMMISTFTGAVQPWRTAAMFLAKLESRQSKRWRRFDSGPV